MCTYLRTLITIFQLEEHGQCTEAIQEPGNPSTVARDNQLKVHTPQANHKDPEPNLQMGY